MKRWYGIGSFPSMSVYMWRMEGRSFSTFSPPTLPCVRHLPWLG